MKHTTKKRLNAVERIQLAKALKTITALTGSQLLLDEHASVRRLMLAIPEALLVLEAERAGGEGVTEELEADSRYTDTDPLPLIFPGLAGRVFSIRKLRNLSQNELSLLSNVSSETISHIETRRRYPTERQITDLAKGLRVLQAYLKGNAARSLEHAGIQEKLSNLSQCSENMLDTIDTVLGALIKLDSDRRSEREEQKLDANTR